MNEDESRIEYPICRILTDEELGKRNRHYIDSEWHTPEDMINYIQKHTNKEILVYIAWKLCEDEVYSSIKKD